jgi:asparagine N-glycosylation enzyme membrane subunit Stt3
LAASKLSSRGISIIPALALVVALALVLVLVLVLGAGTIMALMVSLPIEVRG